MFDKTDKKLTLNEETKKFIKNIKNWENNFDKKGFTKYFSYELTTLITKLLGQNTQDLRKSLDKIKQEKIKLSEDERNSTNNKNKNDELNNMLIVIDKIYQFFEYKFLPGEQSDELSLPIWVNTNKKDLMRYWAQLLKLKMRG